MPANTTFRLLPAEIAHIDLPINGQGGHQSFMLRLRGKLDRTTNEIVLSDGEIGRIVRYVGGYGQGGFQNRFRDAFRRSLREAIG